MLTWPFSPQNGSDIPETITSRDAARFPIIASITLFGLYLFFKVPVKGETHALTATGAETVIRMHVCLQVFSQEYVNLLLSLYFFALGVLALSHTMRSGRLLAQHWLKRRRKTC